MKIITAREANQHFSRLLREAAEGKTIVVTSRGKPVAQITGLTAKADDRLEARKRAFVNELRSRKTSSIEPWSRNELYED
ncbi:MAG: type II toxin-antitoxin system prevent-host-death family antitoxin [Nitrococcus mobilis]|nr:type II toxin-antitoxin system prevent-host-death family antitoxin [Nitrococcus mobilis]